MGATTTTTTTMPVKCDKCGKVCKQDGMFTGYAVLWDGRKYCYQCSAEVDAQRLRGLAIGESMHLYLVVRNNVWRVNNFTGLLSLPVYRIKFGRHNFAGIRYDFWFIYYKQKYHGVVYGDDTQLAKVTRVKNIKGVR